MSPSTARQVIRNCLMKCGSCELVQFFGGEPTLNLDAIEAAVKEILELVRSGNLTKPPRLAIVTNGVVRDFERFIEFICTNGVEITVSLDGPACIHDHLRPRTTGSATYDRAIETLMSVAGTGLPLAIEAVYTAHHLRQGFSVVDLFRFCKDLGVKKLIFDVAYPPAPADLNPLADPYLEQLLSYYVDAVDVWCRGLLVQGNEPLRVYFRDLLLAILDGRPAVPPQNGCAAGEYDFAIGPDGSLFPCQLFYGDPKYYIGNVISRDFPGMHSSFPTGTADIRSCESCFARHWCQPCAALNRNCGDVWVSPERLCALRKSVVLRIGYWAFNHLAVPDNEITRDLRSVVELA